METAPIVGERPGAGSGRPHGITAIARNGGGVYPVRTHMAAPDALPERLTRSEREASPTLASGMAPMAALVFLMGVTMRHVFNTLQAGDGQLRWTSPATAALLPAAARLKALPQTVGAETLRHGRASRCRAGRADAMPPVDLSPMGAAGRAAIVAWHEGARG